MKFLRGNKNKIIAVVVLVVVAAVFYYFMKGTMFGRALENLVSPRLTILAGPTSDQPVHRSQFEARTAGGEGSMPGYSGAGSRSDPFRPSTAQQTTRGRAAYSSTDTTTGYSN